MKIGIIGCGYVFDKYMSTWCNHSDLAIAGVTDIDPARTAAVSDQYGLPTYPDNATLLSDPDIEIVVSLTPIKAHYEITKAALEAGKHVYSEKPLVARMEQARELVELAEERGLRLSCAPSNAMGAASQTMWKAVADGAIGKPRLVYAEFDTAPCYLLPSNDAQASRGSISFPYLHATSTLSVTGAPFPFIKEFEMGCTYEHVGYHLTWMCAIFGPVKSVTSFSKEIMPDKTDCLLDPAGTPDFSVAALEFHSGVVGRVTCSIAGGNDTGMRIIGDRGILRAETYGDYRCPVFLQPFSKLAIQANLVKAVRHSSMLKWFFGVGDVRLPLVETASDNRLAVTAPWWNPLARLRQAEMNKQDKCVGIAELAAAIAEDRPHFPSHAYTLHLTELTLAIQVAGADSETHVMETSFEPLALPETTRLAGTDYSTYRQPKLRTRMVAQIIDRIRGR